MADRYQATNDFSGYYYEDHATAFPDLQFGNNASWSYINAGSGDYHSSLLLLDTYGKGKLFTLAVPDMFADFAALPVPVMDLVRRAFAVKDIYISGRNVSLFLYDNNTFVLYCYAGKDSLPQTVTIHMLREASCIRSLDGKKQIALSPKTCRYEDWSENEWIGQTLVSPGEFYAFEIVD
ncbi:MAG: hypothetical protein J1F41_11505, partial [Lachnospiraceae bacterium]|nr:hypothetical protein [Lachnospiraceae bacterium]